MKTVAISTFNNSPQNYGAVFQACALSSYIKQLGCEPINVTIVDRNNSGVSFKNNLKIKAKKLLMLPKYTKIRRRRECFKRFAGETQNQAVYQTLEELEANPPQADVYLSGSDQVWNPVKIHRDFFLSYAPDSARKISYAASMGNEIIPDANKELFKRYIQTYDRISVREDTMVPIISKFVDKPVEIHVDPVFLMSRDDWKRLEKPYRRLPHDQFILVYAVQWKKEWNDILSDLKRRTGLPMISVNMGNLHYVNAENNLYDVSPDEFLFLLSKARYVATSSFHGTAMSIIYHKKFITLTGSDKPSRIMSLLRRFNLTEGLERDPDRRSFDWDSVDRIIENSRAQSRDYLTKALEINDSPMST